MPGRRWSHESRRRVAAAGSPAGLCRRRSAASLRGGDASATGRCRTLGSHGQTLRPSTAVQASWPGPRNAGGAGRRRAWPRGWVLSWELAIAAQAAWDWIPGRGRYPFGHHDRIWEARFCLNIPDDRNRDRRVFIGQSQDKGSQIRKDCDGPDKNWPIVGCSSSELRIGSAQSASAFFLQIHRPEHLLEWYQEISNT